MKRKTRPFGFVRVRAGRSSPYLAGFNPPGGGREVTRAFRTEAEADLWLAEHHVNVGKGAFVHPNGAKTLLRDYWRKRMAEAQLRPSSTDTYWQHWRNHIEPQFGHREIGSIRRGEIQAWINRLPVAPRTAKTVLAVFQSVMKAAVMVDELIPKSNAVGVRAPAATRRRLIVPTAEEVYAIAAAIHGPYRVTVHLAAEVGLRQGEILGLRVEDLDLLRHTLTVSRQAQTIRGRGVVLDLPPKSEAGYRVVPLAPETVDALALHLATYGSPGGLVVTTSGGTAARRQTHDDAWAKAKRKADAANPALRFHDLRHRYASVLIEAGLDALTVKTLMGHASIEETYDTYGHLFRGQEERAAKAISASIGAVLRTNSRTKTGESPGQGL